MPAQAVQSKVSSAVQRRRAPVPACAFHGCGRSPEASFHQCSVCLPHFIFACYVRLEKCKKHSWVAEPQAKQRTDLSFLVAAAEQSLRLFETWRGDDNLERARLYDIHLWSSELLAYRDLSGLASPLS